MTVRFSVADHSRATMLKKMALDCHHHRVRLPLSLARGRGLGGGGSRLTNAGRRPLNQRDASDSRSQRRPQEATICQSTRQRRYQPTQDSTGETRPLHWSDQQPPPRIDTSRPDPIGHPGGKMISATPTSHTHDFCRTNPIPAAIPPSQPSAARCTARASTPAAHGKTPECTSCTPFSSVSVHPKPKLPEQEARGSSAGAHLPALTDVARRARHFATCLPRIVVGPEAVYTESQSPRAPATGHRWRGVAAIPRVIPPEANAITSPGDTMTAQPYSPTGQIRSIEPIVRAAPSESAPERRWHRYHDAARWYLAEPRRYPPAPHRTTLAHGTSVPICPFSRRSTCWTRRQPPPPCKAGPC
jgi:hypothetical protein